VVRLWNRFWCVESGIFEKVDTHSWNVLNVVVEKDGGADLINTEVLQKVNNKGKFLQITKK
jgi:hypothetical protein